MPLGPLAPAGPCRSGAEHPGGSWRVHGARARVQVQALFLSQGFNYSHYVLVKALTIAAVLRGP
jgi:hypothetical protein